MKGALFALLLFFTACGGTPRDPVQSSCADLAKDLAAELASIRTCSADADCGRDVPAFGSCGCTHNPVVRKNADTVRYFKLFETMQQKSCEASQMMGTCDCPPVSKENGGSVCRSNRCEWNVTARAAGSSGGAYEAR